MNIEHYFEEQGHGSPIVFIHGSYATTSTWKKMVEQLALNHRCILLKLPGHCGTPDPTDFSSPTIDTELDLLCHVVNTLTEEPVHLVGHSYGGVIALAQALRGDLNLSQLSLFEPVAVSLLDHENRARVQTFLAQYRHGIANKLPFVCGQVIDFWAGDGVFKSLPAFIKEGMEALVENNLRHWQCEAKINYDQIDSKRFTVPTRLICGTHSNLVANAICDYLSNHIPNSKKYRITGASHFLVTSHPAACVEILEDESILKDL